MLAASMPDRFAFPSRPPADSLADALRALSGVTLVDVAPRFVLAGARWVVLVRCDAEASMEAAFRVARVRSLEQPDVVQPVLEVVGFRRHSGPPEP
jgi:hypothetical protein